MTNTPLNNADNAPWHLVSSTTKPILFLSLTGLILCSFTFAQQPSRVITPKGIPDKTADQTAQEDIDMSRKDERFTWDRKFGLSIYDKPSTTSSSRSTSYRETVNLLKKFLAANSDDEDEVFAHLFEVGDSRTDELVRALNDPDVSNVAQRVIRYLGNPRGMAGLEKWYKDKDELLFTGPVPFPLIKQDIGMVEWALTTSSLHKWGDIEKYIYALAFDESAEARNLLKKILDQNKTPEESTGIGSAITHIRSLHSRTLTGNDADLAKLVWENAFFVSQNDKKYTTTTLMGLTAAKDKALINVYINRGYLAEEWYDVVLRKTAGGWEFLSVTQTAVS